MRRLNPESMVLSQLDSIGWEKVIALLLWKFAKTAKVTLTNAEILEAMREFEARGGVTVYTHGHVDSLDLQLVSMEEAQRIVAHERMRTGGKH